MRAETAERIDRPIERSERNEPVPEPLDGERRTRRQVRTRPKTDLLRRTPDLGHQAERHQLADRFVDTAAPERHHPAADVSGWDRQLV